MMSENKQTCLRGNRKVSNHNNMVSHTIVFCLEEGLENFDEILKETDGIMVARGDLGMEIPSCKVFMAQKWMVRKCNIAGKFVVVATQMLESMINNPRPTRAECSDVANAVLDGTDAVMLSGESANSPYFEVAVQIMSRTVTNAEQSRNYNVLYQSIRNSILHTYGSMSAGESIASSAVKTSIDVGAKLIVIMSDTGKMANYVAKFRYVTQKDWIGLELWNYHSLVPCGYVFLLPL